MEPKGVIWSSPTGVVSGEDITLVATGTQKWIAAVALAEKIYCVPWCAEKMLVYDPKTGDASGVDILPTLRNYLSIFCEFWLL